MRPNLQQVIDELKRELGVRRSFYPGWVSAKKLTQQTANHRIACIEENIYCLESLKESIQTHIENEEQ
jgi:hypothetical protein